VGGDKGGIEAATGCWPEIERGETTVGDGGGKVVLRVRVGKEE